MGELGATLSSVAGINIDRIVSVGGSGHNENKRSNEELNRIEFNSSSVQLCFLVILILMTALSTKRFGATVSRREGIVFEARNDWLIGRSERLMHHARKETGQPLILEED